MGNRLDHADALAPFCGYQVITLVHGLAESPAILVVQPDTHAGLRHHQLLGPQLVVERTLLGGTLNGVETVRYGFRRCGTVARGVGVAGRGGGEEDAQKQRNKAHT